MISEREYLSYDLWVDIKRFPEYAGFQLAMGIYKSAVVWEILEERRSPARVAWDAQNDMLRRVYSVHQFFSQRHRGLAASVHIDLTARKLGLTARDVRQALSEARWYGVPELIAAAG